MAQSGLRASVGEGDAAGAANGIRKTKIVCTIGPSTSSREMIWQLAAAGMNVARLNMSHGDHASHQKTIDLVKEFNAQSKNNVIAIMLDTKVCCVLAFFFLAADSLFYIIICLLCETGLVNCGLKDG